MAKHVLRARLLPVITAAALVISISAAGAVTASPAGAATAGSALAPCTAPIFGPDKVCESTSPMVDRWVQFYSGDESCTYTLFVDWGDGNSSSRTLVDPIPDVYLIASHTYGAEAQTTTYTETVTSSAEPGTCKPVPTTVFKFTHLLSAVAPSLDGQSLGGLGISKACQASILKDLGGKVAEFAVLLGLFAAAKQAELIELLIEVGGLYLAFEFIHTCDEHPTSGLSVLPKAFAYGASHPGKLFKPAGNVPPRPQITGIYGYQKGSLVYFSLTYADPGHDAKGFGFVGINGAGWAEENHPFSSPSYGIVGNDRIDYPFNLACGTAHQYNSYVEAWIYDSQGLRSNPVEIALTCTN